MKKTIICLSMALTSLMGFANATNPVENQFELVSPYSGTPLCHAISKGDTDVVRKFIEYGVDVNETSNGMTPLMVAARYNRAEIIQILLDSGANPKIKTENGYTALRYAEISNASDAIAILEAKK